LGDILGAKRWCKLGAVSCVIAHSTTLADGQDCPPITVHSTRPSDRVQKDVVPEEAPFFDRVPGGFLIAAVMPVDRNVSLA
jgi:hypothetical protein